MMSHPVRLALAIALLTALCGHARAADLCAYAANVNGSWGQGIDTRTQPCTGAGAFAILNAPATLDESIARRWGLFVSRDTTGIIGGQPGSSNGAIVASVTTGTQSTSGENAVMGIISDHSTSGGGSVGINATVGRYGTRPLWGIAVDAQEYNAPNPIEGVVPIEIAYTASGEDANRKRGLLQVLSKARDETQGASFSAGILVAALGNTRYYSGIKLTGAIQESGISMRGATMLSDTAIDLGINQKIVFGAASVANDGVATTFRNTSTGKFQMQLGDQGQVAFPNLPGFVSGPTPQYVCIQYTTIYASNAPCR